ncbi:hypothetical protein MCELANE86_00482 [Candidatus Nanopelagicaceae bacterium]
MELQERLKLAQEAGPKYEELTLVFEAAVTEDLVRLNDLRMHTAAGVRFAAFTNPLKEVSFADLNLDSLIKYAAIYNPTTSMQILDTIGLNKTSVNPIIPEAIHTHKNASQEFQVFRAITDFETLVEFYEDANEEFYREVFFDGLNDHRIDFDYKTLQALLFLNILGRVEVPDIWFFYTIFMESEDQEMLKIFAELPTIPNELQNQLEAIVRLRSLSASWIKDSTFMKSFISDRGLEGEEYDSPAFELARNHSASPEILQSLFDEEIQYSSIPDFTVLERLAINPNSSTQVLENIMGELEEKNIEFEREILDNLASNPALEGTQRKRLEKIMREKGFGQEP